MKLDTKSVFSPATVEKISADPLYAFVVRNHSALWEAVRFISGYETSRLVDKCLVHLERDGRLTPRTRMMIDQVHSVISLEDTGDPDFPLMAHFVAIDPEDPIVEEICLLCDRLNAAMAESALLQCKEVNAEIDPRAT